MEGNPLRLRPRALLALLVSVLLPLGTIVVSAGTAQAASDYCVTPLKTTLRDGVTAIARLCVHDAGSHRVKDLSLERSTPTDNPWVQFIVSDGTSRTYSYHDLEENGASWYVSYYIATWRLCDPYAGYCTAFVPIAA